MSPKTTSNNLFSTHVSYVRRQKKTFDYLGSAVESTEGSSAPDVVEDLVINNILRSMILDKDGAYPVDLNNTIIIDDMSDVGGHDRRNDTA